MRGKKIVIFRQAALIFLMTATALLATGCGKKTPSYPIDKSGKSELYIWRATEYKDLFAPYAATFMQNNKTVQLWYVQQDIKDYEFRTIDQIAADLKPHVWSIPVDWLPDNKDKLVPMPDNILGENTVSAAFMKDKFIAGGNKDVERSYIIDGKVWGIPFVIDSLILFYNSRLFSEAFERWQTAHPRNDVDLPSEEELRVQKLLAGPPKTWQDLVDLVPLLTIRQGSEIKQSAIALGTADNVNNADDIVQLLIYQNGGSIVSDTGDRLAQFKDERVKESGEKFFPGKSALEFYTSFSNPSKEVYSWNKSLPNSAEAFAQGKVAMIIDYPTQREELGKKYPEKFPEPFEIPTTAMIQISDAQDPVNFGSYSVETVTKAALAQNKVNLAWSWILSYMKTESSTAITEIIKRPSPHKSLTEERAKDPNGIISKQALTARIPYKRHHAAFDAAFLQMIRNVTDSGQSAEAAINQTNDKINQIIQQP